MSFLNDMFKKFNFGHTSSIVDNIFDSEALVMMRV